MSFQNKINGIKEIWHFENRWQLIINRLFFSHEPINIYRYKGMDILIDHSAGDANGAREVLVNPMYRQFLPQMDLSGSINVLDIGANNGGFPLLLKSENINIKKLVSVELNPKTFSRMRFNVERNIDCDFIGINAAVCGENCDLKLKIGDGSTSDSIYNESKNGHFLNIQGITLDSLIIEKFGDEVIDLCKIDIEGAEFEIFEKGNFQLLKNCSYLLMEIHHESDRDRNEVRRKLFELGFNEFQGENKNESNKHYVHLFINNKSIELIVPYRSNSP
jgi:FkbM family methyltransferase